MRTLAEITEDASLGSAFSDGRQYEIWSNRWCARCTTSCLDCPLIDSAFLGFLPQEWTPVLDKEEREVPGNYRCSSFRKQKAIS